MPRKYRVSSVPIALASSVFSAFILVSVSCSTAGNTRGDGPEDTEQSTSVEHTLEQPEVSREEERAEELSQKPVAASAAGCLAPPTNPVKNGRTLTYNALSTSQSLPIPTLPEEAAATLEDGNGQEREQQEQQEREPFRRQEEPEPHREELEQQEQEEPEPRREEPDRPEQQQEQEHPSRQVEPAPRGQQEDEQQEDKRERVQRVETEIPSERKSVWAAPGDTVELILDERGWVYDQGSSSAQGVDFRERSYTEESTEFVFRVRRTGNFQLTFFREDMSTGERKQQIVDIISSLLEEVPEGLGTAPPESAEGSGEPASRKEIREAVDRGDSGYLARNIESLVHLASEGREPGSLSLVIEAAQALLEGGRQIEAQSILKSGLENTAVSEDERETLYFYLGQLYESHGPLRDEHRAADYYQKVIESFPAGIYWNDARERKRYLERHYLQVR